MLEIRLLGRFDLRVDGQSIPLPSRSAQSLLAYLALRADAPLRRELLAGVCWPQASDANARRYLRQALWRIRRVIGPGKVSGAPLILSDDLQVRFNLEADVWLDTRVLEGRPPRWDGIDALIESVSQYQGELLPGFYDDWISLERERLRSVFEHKVGLLLTGLLEEHRWREAIEWAEHWIARGTAPEPAFRALMLAHNGIDDRSGIGTAYRRGVEALRSELGVAPDEETTGLFEALVGGRELALEPELAAPPAGSGLSGIPIPTSPLVDRTEELAQIEALLDGGECRLLTLTGLGGTGKTRLATEAGLRRMRTNPNGVTYFSAGELPSADLFVVGLARALGVSLSGQRGYLEQIGESLAGRDLLVVVDGFEQTMESASIVGEILLRNPRVKFMITSRQRLDLQGEWVLEVRGLAVPDGLTRQGVESSPAAQLFLQTARHLDPNYQLIEEDLHPVAELCQLTEGLPLAIEMAASWTRLLSCQSIVDQVKENIGFLSTTRRDLPARQRSVLATFEHSWRSLAPSEQQVFRRLAVFRGGLDRRSAMRITGATLASLSSLVDKSLVSRLAADRLALHSLVAEFARAKLDEAGEADEIAERHRDWYLEIAAEREPRLWGSAPLADLEWLEAEQDNLRAALRWSMSHGQTEPRLRLTTALAWFWYVRGLYPEGRHWMEQALGASEGASPLLLSRALYQCSLMASQQGDHARAGELSVRALSLLEETDSLWDRGWALASLGYAAQQREDHRLAHACFAEAEEVFREENFQGGVVTMTLYKGIACGMAGDRQTAAALVTESLHGLRDLGDTLAVARGLHFLGELALHRGDTDEATRLCAEALESATQKGNRNEIGQCLEGLASVLLVAGDPLAGARLVGAAERIRRYLGSPGFAQVRQRIEIRMSDAAMLLPHGALDAARQEGMAMGLGEAIDYAFEQVAAAT